MYSLSIDARSVSFDMRLDNPEGLDRHSAMEEPVTPSERISGRLSGLAKELVENTEENFYTTTNFLEDQRQLVELLDQNQENALALLSTEGEEIDSAILASGR